MENILRQNNLSLRRDVERLRRFLEERKVSLPTEWRGCCDWALAKCGQIRGTVERNLRDLDYHQPTIFPDVLSQTQAATRELFQLSRQASPALRGSDGDRVALRVLLWLHLSHPKTKGVPVAVSNEDFSIWPVIPTMYLLPCTVQHSLLYLPLFFHEFGHLLYALHHQEMDALVKSLQEKIADLLTPMIHFDDAMASEAVKEQQIVVERWYEWTQELFCDAVGLTIGGSAYVRAFSTYLRMRGRDHFVVLKPDLELQPHPVTWLRIRMLARRLRANSPSPLADELEQEWAKIAGLMNVTEDYFGFFSDAFVDPLRTTLNDMLVEAWPAGLESPADDMPAVGGYKNPLPILTSAWNCFSSTPTAYEQWENDAVKQLLSDASGL